MLNETVQRTYIFNGHGHALSGHITHPTDHQIEVQAGMSLPTTGGVGQSRVENFRFHHYASFGVGHTYVVGSKSSADTYSTLVTSVVEDLNILDVVRADRVVARLASSHRLDEAEPRITLLCSTIENLRICGCPVQIEFDNDLFLRCKTFETLKKEFDGNAEFRKMAADPAVTTPPKVPADPQGVFLCSLVKSMKVDCASVKTAGHLFEVPEFGRVYVGEVLAQYRKRTLTMLRFELGCPVVGGFVAAQTIGNGHPWP
jgi:hypothetical protein